jgi:hypothetical protein
MTANLSLAAVVGFRGQADGSFGLQIVLRNFAVTLALSIGGGGTLNMLMVLLTASQLSPLHRASSCSGLEFVYCEWLIVCESTLWLSQSC